MMNELHQHRNYLVVKSNLLVLQTRYKYSIQQQKMIAYICSRIKPDCKNLEFRMTISEYLKIMNIANTGYAYEEVKNTLQSLTDKSMWLTSEDGTLLTLVRWLNKVKVDLKRKEIIYILDSDLVPYLIELKERFLSYSLRNIVHFKCKYSIRIFEFLKTIYNLKNNDNKNNSTINIEYKLDELKDFLMIESDKYKDFKDFKKRVLLPAQKEINLLSDISFEFETIKYNKRIVGINFIVKSKEYDEFYQTYLKNNSLYKTK